MTRTRHYLTFLIILFSGVTQVFAQEKSWRKVTSLDGTWNMGISTSFNIIASTFNHRIEVPGLVDMAIPKMDTSGMLTGKVFWYRKMLQVNNAADVAQLKIFKSMYHTRVYVNRVLAGDNFYCFTPTLLNIRRLLKPGLGENEFIIAVGCREALPGRIASGFDYEKIKYTPGIYDEVALIQSGFPFISNVQVAPDLKRGRITVQVHLEKKVPGTSEKLSFVVRELKSGKIIAHRQSITAKDIVLENIPLPEAMTWSPEHPFLYTLETSSRADSKVVRFGYREFGFRKGSIPGFLNNKPYYLRGTNVTIMRFFEDPERGPLPWNDHWVINLHKSFKDFHWNSMRYCIGFPPERWYEVADSLGIMIQDEFPVWSMKDSMKAGDLALEYKDWIQERWNHPSVVIWDAQNETRTVETGKALSMVRSLDLSRRPWDNGYAAPQLTTDPIESHPYLFVRYFDYDLKPSGSGAAADMLTGRRLPHNDPNEVSPAADGHHYDNSVIINEYSWLWLNRDGSTTKLTDKVYPVMFGDSLSKAQRLEYYARYLAMLTEYWRCHRTSAGVMHFCSLGYSRSSPPRGQTSDNFSDVASLSYEPQFTKYVKPSFAPVGLMIDAWYREYKASQQVTLQVYVINDTDAAFSDSLHLEVLQEGKVLTSRVIQATVASNAEHIFQFAVEMPAKKGKFELFCYYLQKGEKIFSTRAFEIR